VIDAFSSGHPHGVTVQLPVNQGRISVIAVADPVVVGLGWSALIAPAHVLGGRSTMVVCFHIMGCGN